MENISISCNAKNSNNNLIVIIGNRFGKFANTHSWAITFSQFENELEAVPIAPENQTSFIYGQGLHDDQLQRVENWLSKNNRLSAKFPKRACRWLTHKHESKNILISDFFKVSENVFRADLLIDDRNELLTDHVSGHISGMTEVEAIRQSFLAVTEQFYIAKGESSSRVFVTLSKRVEFKKFFFPLPAYVEFSMTEANVSPSGKNRFKAHVTLHQANQIFGEANIEYCVLFKTQLSKKEVDQANSITQFFIKKPEASKTLNDQTLWACTNSNCENELDGFYMRSCNWCGHEMVPICQKCGSSLEFSNGQCKCNSVNN